MHSTPKQHFIPSILTFHWNSFAFGASRGTQSKEAILVAFFGGLTKRVTSQGTTKASWESVFSTHVSLKASVWRRLETFLVMTSCGRWDSRPRRQTKTESAVENRGRAGLISFWITFRFAFLCVSRGKDSVGFVRINCWGSEVLLRIEMQSFWAQDNLCGCRLSYLFGDTVYDIYFVYWENYVANSIYRGTK